MTEMQKLVERVEALEARFKKPTIDVVSLSGKLPQYESEGAAGLDLEYYGGEDAKPIVFEPGERKLIPTGIFVSLVDWDHYVMAIRPRSGLAIREGFTVLNSPGTIDSDYRGEIKVIGINLSRETVVIQPGERCAQAVIHRQVQIGWNQLSSVELLSDTKRGDGGFGHTGKS